MESGSLWKDNKDRLGTRNDKPGVAHVLREHKPYVSEVFQNSLDEPAISISEPVFAKEEFIGIVRWMVTIDTIAKRFIQPVKVGKKGIVWLMDEQGRLLVHPDSSQTLVDLLLLKKKQAPGYDWSELEDIIRKSTMGQEGVGMYTCTTCGTRIIAYVPVHLGNRVWSIGVSMDYSEIAEPILDHAMHHIEITALIMALLIAGGFLFYRMERRRTSDLIYKNRELEQEVTERRRAEEALLESEGKLAGIVDSVTDLMIMVDNQFNIVWANDIAQDLFGRDMVGKKCHSIYHGRDTVCEPCNHEKSANHGCRRRGYCF